MDNHPVADSKGRDIRAIIASVVLFLMIPPVFVWSLFTISYGFRFICSLVYFVCVFKEIGPQRNNRAICYLLFLLMIVFYLRVGFNLASAISTIIFASTFLLNRLFLKRLAHYFFLLFAILLVPSIVQYVLVSFFGLPFPHKTISPLNELKIYDSSFGSYQRYAFFVQYESAIVLFPRFSAYFDEAGVIGSFCAFALYFYNYKLKNWYNVVFLLAGLFSFSLFFYVTSIVYVLFFMEISNSQRNKKRLQLLGKVSIVLVIAAIFIFLYLQDNDVLNLYLFNRLQFDDDKGFVGNNRDVSAFRDWYEDFRFSSNYWLGFGGRKSLEVNEGGASYKNIIVDYGFIGLFLYVFLFLLLSRNSYKSNKTFYMFVLLFIMMIYQRPFITQIAYYQLFIYLAECRSEGERSD